MSGNQEQDLVFFRDNSIISDAVLESGNSYLSTIAYIEGTQPTWLVNSLIENGLCGTGSLVNKDLKASRTRATEVVCISFSNNLEFFSKGCKKNGLDLTRERNFKFIDCFTDLFTKLITNPGNSTTEVKALFENIYTQIKKSPNTKRIIFIENPEFLLAATSISSIELSNYLLKLNRLCSLMFVISCHTFPQIVDTTVNDPHDPVFKTSDFLTKLHQRTHLNIYVEPLTTGRAKDITGIITISKGSIPFEPKIIIDEKSYTYNLTKESNIKLYFR